MVSLGVRVEPKVVHLAIVNGSKSSPNIVDTEKIKANEDEEEGEQLSFYRRRMMQVFEEYKVDCLGLKQPEAGNRSAGTNSAMRRLRIEGVIMEAATSQSIPIYAAGTNIQIAVKLGASTDVKKYIKTLRETADQFRGVDIADYSKEMRDAIFAAIAALNNEEE